MLGACDDVLLWMTEWGIWSNSENLHLYYRLRQSYQDFRLLHDAPGHLFLKHETADLISFLHLAMLNGWGGYLISFSGRERVFFSHDAYMQFYPGPNNDGTQFRNWINGIGPI
jgi:hypothetical protein